MSFVGPKWGKMMHCASLMKMRTKMRQRMLLQPLTMCQRPLLPLASLPIPLMSVDSWTCLMCLISALSKCQNVMVKSTQHVSVDIRSGTAITVGSCLGPVGPPLHLSHATSAGSRHRKAAPPSSQRDFAWFRCSETGNPQGRDTRNPGNTWCSHSTSTPWYYVMAFPAVIWP